MCPPNATGVPMRGEIWKYRDTHREERPLQTQLQRAEGRREAGGGREGSHAPQAKERLGHRSPQAREGRSGRGRECRAWLFRHLGFALPASGLGE